MALFQLIGDILSFQIFGVPLYAATFLAGTIGGWVYVAATDPDE